MLSSILFTALFAVMSLIFDNVASARARRLSGRDSNIENSYIVKLKDGTNHTNHINSLPFSFSVEDENSPVTHWWPEFFKGYSGIFVGADLDAIRASPDVEYVEKHVLVRASEVQTDAPWGLQAISTQHPVGDRSPRGLTYSYWYNEPIGEGVDIYIIDTGVYIEHSEFEGRATFGWADRGLTMKDGSGHGTHMAAIAAGKTCGVAKKANIIAVKILDDVDWATPANVIAGIVWVLANVKRTRRPSIACMAFGTFEISRGVNDVTTMLVGQGVTVVAAAGSLGIETTYSSPISSGVAIVVAASDINNAMDPDSEFGPAVNVFAPGVDILTAGIKGPHSSDKSNGGSPACAHVAGLAAYFLSMDRTMTPYLIFQKILSVARKNIISGVPSGTTTDFVFNGGVP